MSTDYSQQVADILDALGDSPTPDEAYHATRNYDERYVAAALAASVAAARGGGGGSQTIAEILAASNDAAGESLNNLVYVGADVVNADAWDIQNSNHLTLNAPLDVNGKALSGLAEPSTDSEAATKKYVDDTAAPTLAALIAADNDANGGTIANLADPAGDQDADTPAARNAAIAEAIAAAIAASRVPLDYAQYTAGGFPFTTGDTIIAGNEIALDGATPISVEFYTPVVAWDAVAEICHYTLSLYDGATELGAIADGDFAAGDIVGNMPFYVRTPPFTPTIGNHTYAVKAKIGSGGVEGGTGVGGDPFPMYIRVNRA